MYVTLDQVQALIPPGFLTEALDDDGDGVIDAWDQVAAAACNAVDGLISTRYALPLPEIPAVIAECALNLACEICYGRRGVGAADNPFSSKAKAARDTLLAIASGELPLAPDLNRAKPSGVVLTERSRTHSRYLAA
jgi:phage gp36-like protein